jgi:hypothetical protein
VPGSASADDRDARVIEPTLVQRATLSADFLAPGPPSGALASPANGRTGPFGVYPETKHPTYFDSIGLPLEEALRRP